MVCNRLQLVTLILTIYIEQSFVNAPSNVYLTCLLYGVVVRIKWVNAYKEIEKVYA